MGISARNEWFSPFPAPFSGISARIGWFFRLPALIYGISARNSRFFLLPAPILAFSARVFVFRKLAPRGTPYRVAFEAFFVLFLWRYPL